MSALMGKGGEENLSYPIASRFWDVDFTPSYFFLPLTTGTDFVTS